MSRAQRTKWSMAGEQGGGLLVAVDAGSDEVVGAEIADFEDGVGDGIGEVDELAAVVGGADGGLVVVAAGGEGGDGEAAHGTQPQGEEDVLFHLIFFLRVRTLRLSMRS